MKRLGTKSQAHSGRVMPKSRKTTGAASPEVGAGTTYSYGKSGQRQRNNSPTKATD